MLRGAKVLIPTLVVALLVGAQSLAAQNLVVDPPRPTPQDALSLRVEYDSANCLVDTQIDSFERTLLVRAVEDCECNQLLGPNVAEVGLGPLGAGIWHVEVDFTNESGVPCSESPPAPIRDNFLVQHRATFLSMTLDPAEPVAGEPVAILTDSLCPFAWDESIDVAGRVVEVTEVESTQGAPCLETGGYLSRVELGELTEGPFTALFVSDVGSEAPEFILPFEFDVAAATVAEARMQRDRFAATARWRTTSGESGAANSTSGSRGDSDELWFFNRENVEVMVKVLDGCAINGFHWVFAAGLTDLGVDLTVTDQATGAVREYSTPAGELFGTLRDNEAFACATP